MLTAQCDAAFPVACINATTVVPEPLLSSRSRQWNGIVVELRRASNVDGSSRTPITSFAWFLLVS
jgi:hypothetical protein